jgi:GTP cyclohydrolase I
MSSNVLALEPVRNFHGDGKPDRAEVEAAVRTIIRWSGEDPDREGLIETPARVTRAYEEAFVGYTHDPAAILQKSFDEIEGYDEPASSRGISQLNRLRTGVFRLLDSNAKAVALATSRTDGRLAGGLR